MNDSGKNVGELVILTCCFLIENYDGVVKSPLYCVVAHFRSLCYLFARHTRCMASLTKNTLLLGVYAYLYTELFEGLAELAIYLAIPLLFTIASNYNVVRCSN